MISLGLIGANTSHADAFSRIFNGDGETPPTIDDARITHIWGADAERAGALATTHHIDAIVAEPREMVDRVDGVLIIDDTGGGETHADLAAPFLEAGMAVFVDKPMTTDYADAVALFDLAEKHNAPLTSSSALRYPVELDPEAIAACGKLSSVLTVGPGEWFYYGVHAVELLGTVTDDAPVSVHRHVLENKDVAVVTHESGIVAVVETLRDAGYLFHCAVFGENGHTAFDANDMKGFYANQMRAVAEMVKTRKAPVTREQTLAVMAILHVGNLSAAEGRTVQISEITEA